MVPMVSKIVTLGAAVLAYNLFPTEFAHCEPILARQHEEESTQQIFHTFDKCLSLLNQGCHWVIESSNFALSNTEERKSYDNALFQLMRADENVNIDVSRDEKNFRDNEEHRNVPLMRVVSFYPNITSGEVYIHLLDLQRRPQWDANYEKYVKFSEDFICNTRTKNVSSDSRCKGNSNSISDFNNSSNTETAIECENSMLHLQNVIRPIQRFTKKRVVCNGSVCSRQPDVMVTKQDHGWFAHRVGSSMLRRLGIHSRLFVYERLSYKYEYMGNDEKSDNDGKHTNEQNTTANSNDNVAYDVLFHGTKETINHCVSTNSLFRQWWTGLLGETTSELVEMHYQHILLLPIADICKQLTERPTLLNEVATTQGITSSSSTELLYNVLKRNNELEDVNASRRIPGTLLVITSANDVRIPHYLPQWIQKKVASSVGWYAHRALQQAIQQSRDEMKTR